MPKENREILKVKSQKTNRKVSNALKSAAKYLG